MSVKLIIDTDTAVDDAIALLMALRSGIEIGAITIVAGNVEFCYEVRNALYVVENFADRRTPVYLGCDRPLVKTWKYAHDFHGEDGMGNVFLPEPTMQPEEEHAVKAILELIDSEPGEYVIAALGPLTNIAMAARLDSKLSKKIAGVYVMGGSATLKGNVTPIAEFNFWVDPEAAKIVFDSGLNPKVIGWDLVISYGYLTLTEYEELCKGNSKESTFFRTITRHPMQLQRSKGIDKLYLADPLTMSIVLDESVAKRYEPMSIHVDTSDGFMRGVSINVPGAEPNSYFCVEADKSNFLKNLRRSLAL